MVILVTNRKLCREPLIERVEKLIEGRPQAIMVREKDMDQEEYERLALAIHEMCRDKGVDLMINSNPEAAGKIKDCELHLSMEWLRGIGQGIEGCMARGASIHSLEEALEAERLGAHYLVAGHIFETGCKEGLPPRGLGFLKAVCQAVSVPVYAIGGISADRVEEVMDAGASGVCIMSEAMTCDNPEDLVGRYLGLKGTF